MEQYYYLIILYVMLVYIVTDVLAVMQVSSKEKKQRKLKNIIFFKTICGQGALWRAEQEKGGTTNRHNGGRILSTAKNVYNMVKPK